MKRAAVTMLILLGAAAVLSLAACSQGAPAGAPLTPTRTSKDDAAPATTATVSPWPTEIVFDLGRIPGLTEAAVTHVTDGDTIDVSTGGRRQAVRYIGINAPEVNHPTKGLEPGGPEATEGNRRLTAGQTVYLEKDVSETDQYGRLLRYVYLPGGLMVNAALVWEGLAQAASYPPDVRRQDLLLRMQRDARASGRGLWGSPSEPAREDPGATCDRCIKGNISGQGEKIYHLPGCETYESVRIDESRGESYFSSEAEARAAGWRKAGNCP